jgi:transcription initiation factor TFIID subunit 5
LQVTDYLLKRGFTKTEAIFRQESSNLGADGRPKHKRAEDMGPRQYTDAFKLLKDWVDKTLDIYKVNQPLSLPLDRFMAGVLT